MHERGHSSVALARRELLRKRLSKKYELRPTTVQVATHQLKLYEIGDIDAVLDMVVRESIDPDRAAPYWTEIWPSSRALAEFLLSCVDMSGKKVLELGCGPALTALAAKLSGARVTVSDLSRDALDLAELNWHSNFDQPLGREIIDWNNPPADRKYDIIVAADVAYEKRLFAPLIKTLAVLLNEHGVIYLSEPNRPIATDFFKRLTEAGFHCQRQESSATGPAIYLIYRQSDS